LPKTSHLHHQQTNDFLLNHHHTTITMTTSASSPLPPPTTIIIQPPPTTPTMTTTWQCHITSPVDKQQQWTVTTATDMPCHPDGDDTCCCHVHID